MEKIPFEKVPIVDFSAYSLEKSEPDAENFQKLVDDVHEAFSTIGFVYLKNFGIPSEKISSCFDSAYKFFSLNYEEKLKYKRPPDSNHGYVQPEREGLNPERKFKDLKEAFNLSPSSKQIDYPDNPPDFRKAVEGLFNSCIPLHQRILEVMARGLKLEDPYFFVNHHKLIGTAQSDTTLRCLNYPPLDNMTIKEDQVRCGEHSDYGAITLLFQDQQGGLEVQNTNNVWIKALPIEGTVLVNIGDLMQRWTADKLKSTRHRVMLPQNSEGMKRFRQSVAFFGHPDRGVIIECIDGSNKYPPVESLEYLNMRFNATYTNRKDIIA